MKLRKVIDTLNTRPQVKILKGDGDDEFWGIFAIDKTDEDYQLLWSFSSKQRALDFCKQADLEVLDS